MTKNRNIFLAVLVLIPAAIHFFLLNKFLVNFPSWGDDIIYLDQIEKFDKISWPERINEIFAFHNYIHRIAFSRTLIILYHKIITNIDFKVIIFLANLQWLVILWVIFKYLKREQQSIWHLVGVSILLFSANGNIDNYGLIGVLQHLSSILFMVLITYGLIYKPSNFYPLFLSLLYPFVSTEGLAFILFIICYLYIIKSKFRVIFSIFSLGIFCFYFHDYVGADHGKLTTEFYQKIYLLGKGIFVFLGSSLKHNVSVAWPIGVIFVGYFCYFFISFLKDFSTKKSINRLFPIVLFVQIFLTATLIAFGRVFNGSEASLQILLADRFYSYGAFLLVVIYLMIIIDCKKTGFIKPVFFIIPACMFGVYSFINAQKRLWDLKKRVQMDASNAFLFKKSANYIFTSRDSYLLSNAGIYQFPFKINGLTQGKINQLKTSGRKLILNQQDQIDPQMGQFRIMNLRPSEIDSRENIVYLEMDGNHLEGILIPVVQINHGLDNIIKVYINGFDYTKPFNAYLINLNLSL